jgi:hypothetical protein
MAENNRAENDLGAESDLGPDLPFDPQELMNQFRQNYINAHEFKKRAPNAFKGVDLKTRKQKPLKENDLSPAVRSVLQQYRQDHPGSKLDLLKYQLLRDGKPITIVEDEGPLPEDVELLTVSQTVTMGTSTEALVTTEMVVASIQRG